MAGSTSLLYNNHFYFVICILIDYACMLYVTTYKSLTNIIVMFEDYICSIQLFQGIVKINAELLVQND